MQDIGLAINSINCCWFRWVGHGLEPTLLVLTQGRYTAQATDECGVAHVA